MPGIASAFTLDKRINSRNDRLDILETYVRPIAILALVAMLISSSGVSASPLTIACLQETLVKLGYDPGPADGAIGRKTRIAAAAFQQSMPSLPELTSDSAAEWCLAAREVIAKGGSAPHLAPDSATNGIALGVEDGATPILSVTPEYQVPGWVNNPH